MTNTRAFVTVQEEGRWALIRGGPARPLLEPSRIAGVELRWARTDRAWLCPTDRVADVVAAGEAFRLVTVRPS
jgi:hypothetical protein